MTFTLDNRSTGDDLSLNPTLLLALEKVELYLSKFATSPQFLENMRLAFGDTFAEETALNLVQAWQNGDFSLVPTIEVLNSSQLNGANGAFAASTNRIYVSRDYLSQVVTQGQIESLVGLLLEEIGHKIDSWLNTQDSNGDEGAIFSDLVRGESLTDERLAQLKAEDDTAVIEVNSEVIQVEQQITRTWNTAVDGFWDVSTNWTNNQPPQTGDDVNISFASNNITTTYRTGNTSLNSLISDEAFVVSGGALTVNNLVVNNTLNLSNGSLTLNGTTASTIDNFTQTGGTLAGSGEVIVNNNFNWTNGTQAGTGKTTLKGNTTLSSANTKWLDTKTIENQGNVAWTNGEIYLYNGAVWHNTATGVFDIQSNNSFAGAMRFC